MTAHARKWTTNGTHLVPYWVYTDRDIYNRELREVFAGRSWNYVGLEAEIPKAGDFKRTRLGETSVIVVRDKDGEIHVLKNQCAHRGLEVCRQDYGTAKTFQCPYHQWTYRLDGDLSGVPFMKGVDGHGGMPEDFDRRDHGLKKLNVATRHGAIFASESDDMPRLEAYLGPKMLKLFDRIFDGRELKVLGILRQRIPANWKLMFENIKDPYHASLLHVFLVTFGLFRVDNPSRTEIDETGMHSALISQRGGDRTATEATQEMSSFRDKLVLHDPRQIEVVKEFSDPATVVMQTIWPNLIVQQQANTLATRQILPVGPEAFDLNWTFFGYAGDDETMTARRLRHANLMGPAGFVSLDDSEVMELAQRGIQCDPTNSALVEMGGRGREDENHIVTETAIRAFYDYYRKAMSL